jgi:hypothetical protein
MFESKTSPPFFPAPVREGALLKSKIAFAIGPGSSKKKCRAKPVLLF